MAFLATYEHYQRIFCLNLYVGIPNKMVVWRIKNSLKIQRQK